MLLLKFSASMYCNEIRKYDIMYYSESASIFLVENKFLLFLDMYYTNVLINNYTVMKYATDWTLYLSLIHI